MNIEMERPRCSWLMLQARWGLGWPRQGVGMAQKRQAGVGRGARDPIHACDQLKIEHCFLILRLVVMMRTILRERKKLLKKWGNILNGSNKRHFLGGGWVGKSGNLFLCAS